MPSWRRARARPSGCSAALDAAPIASVLIAARGRRRARCRLRQAAGRAGAEGPTRRRCSPAMPSSRAPCAPTACISDAGKDLAGAYEQARGILGRPRHRRRRCRHLPPRRHDAGRGRRRLHRLRRARRISRIATRRRARRDELIAWWAEIFEVPCVAFDVETARGGRGAGAGPAPTSSAVQLPAGATPAATRELVAGIAAALSVPETTG